MKRPRPESPRTSDAPKLRSLQRAFASAVMRPLNRRNGMQMLSKDGRPVKKIVAEFIKPNDRLTSFERLEIYNRQYWFRLIGSFYDDFPGLRAVIGERRFQKLTVAYLNRYPSKSYTLRDLGDRLERFLREEPAWVVPHKKLALDIVGLEWAHIVAFDGDERPPLSVDDLLDADPATMTFSLQPYLTLLACEYPVDDYLLAVKRRAEPRGEASNAVSEPATAQAINRAKRPRPEKIWLAVHRLDHGVYYKRLEPAAFVILSGLKKGLPLQVACEKALRRKKVAPGFSEKLQTWFAQWTSFGWFCRHH